MLLDRQVICRLRRGLYWPLDLLALMPGDGRRSRWIVRLVVKLDAPLRRYILEGVNHAKSTG